MADMETVTMADDGDFSKDLTGGTSMADAYGHSSILCDVLVIGAGFCGITAIHRFRKLGMKVKCFESGSGFGGVWHFNTYPGARVDSEVPFYQLNIPEVWQSWTFSERFPGGPELQRYFEHVDKTLNLSKDVIFEARVVDCSWGESELLWTVKTRQGHQAQAKYLVICTGLLHYTFTPDFPGLERYNGELYHAGAWDGQYSVKGKRVAIVGAGSTGVQITQEIGKQADQTTVFVRRPSYCLPMHQRQLTVEEQSQLRPYYPALFKAGRQSHAGFPSERPQHGMFETSAKERTQLLERLWEVGGAAFALNGYNDVIFDPNANKVAYDFWASKVRRRLKDPEKRKIMAPDKAPYYFGTKRIPLEYDYYEVLDQPNVSIHDLRSAPFKTFLEDGIVTADGKLRTFDTVILATGFDSHTGSLTHMGLRNKDGTDLKDEWKEGVHTYLGLTISGYPNMFMGFAPQAPTALSNGPTCIEAQIEIVVDMVHKMELEGVRRIEAQPTAEEEWKASIDEMVKDTLFPFTNSWWNAANVPGKKAGNMLYVAGIEHYEAACRAKLDGWKGFDVHH
ncbi:hypothetical protein LTR37_007598 [Vermiconidia calcicola]|uniref:Uncharacterized protein n=1 Tax=Vermiconidia calcicola TaxID=1690605 RepID=A0ACC3NEI3_9PEZI|nr:hypothetical protein LTR37_007598 [Vermiconidia calcicola]